jgi:hypothetical protein
MGGEYEVVNLTLYRRNPEQSACGLPLLLSVDERDGVRIPRAWSNVSLVFTPLDSTYFKLLLSLMTL